MTNLMEEVAAVAKRVNKELEEIARSGYAGLSDVAFHQVKMGGKRLRPFLVVKSCELLGGKMEDAAPAAVSVELLHNFTLIHDEIMDRDEFRRGAPTVYKVFGEPVAITAGDLLFALVYRHVCDQYRGKGLAEEAVLRIVESLALAAITVCEGQYMDVTLQGRVGVPEDMCITLMAKKTAALYRMSALIGAIVACAPPASEERLSSYGEKVGLAFQMADDLLGLFGDPAETGKPVGNDLTNGKATLIIAYALQDAAQEQRERILRPFGRPGASGAEVEEALEAIRRLGAPERVAEKARGLVEEAKAGLTVFPPCPARRALEELADFVVERRY